MRLSSGVRLGFALCGTLAVWLLSVPSAEAAQPARRHSRVSRAADERPALRRVRARNGVQRSGRHVAKYLLRSERLVHRSVPDYLGRGQTMPLAGHDTAALQTSAAVGGDDLLPAGLRPLGVLSPPTLHPTFVSVASPRSPRGPPSSPA